MATGGAKTIGDVMSDCQKISVSVSEGNLKGAPTSKMPKKGMSGGGGGKGGKGGFGSSGR